MIIDELIALLGFKVDEGSASKAKNAFGGVEAAANKLAGALGAAGLAAGFVKLVEFGHAAAETMDRVDTLFGPAAEGVTEWSDAFGREVGRSRRDLQQMTATVGAMVAPMGVGQDAAAEMGKGLAELAVSLAELNNAEDTATLDALRMGLTGNTRALKQYGLIVDETDLKEAARELGINKGIKALSDAERAQVSYQAILTKGTSITKAGLDPTEALEARLQNLRDTIGLKLLPIADWLAEKLIIAIDFFEGLAKNTHLVEAAFAVLAPIAISTAWSLIAPFLPVVGLFAAIVLIVEDLYTLFTGGDSVIGRFIDSLGGAGTSAAVVETLKDAWNEVVGLFRDNWPMIQDGFRTLGGLIVDAFSSLKGFGEWLGSFTFDAIAWFGSIGEAIGNFAADAMAWIDKLIAKLSDLVSMPEFGKIGGSVLGGLSDIGSSAMGFLGLGESPRTEQVRTGASSTSKTTNSSVATGPLTVVNNFNGIKPSEVDGRMRDAANSTGRHIDRQLRDATAGLGR